MHLAVDRDEGSLKEKSLIFLGLFGAFSSAALLLYITLQIEKSHDQISWTNNIHGFGLFNLTSQNSQNIFRFTQALNDYKLAESDAERGELKKDYLKAFDILWASFVALRQIDKVESAEEVKQFSEESRELVKSLDSVIRPEVNLTKDQISDIVARFSDLFELNNKANNAHFSRFSLFSDRVDQGIANLQRLSMLLILAFSLSLFAIFAYLWRLLSREKKQARDLVLAHEQMTVLVDDLRSGQAEKRAKNQFLAAASHDLRQPLHALGLFLNSLEKSVDDDEGRYLLDKIRSSTGALNGLFNSLLDISRLDAGVVHVNPTHVNLDRLLGNIKAEYSQIAQQESSKLFVQKCGLAVFTDEVLLLRILRNLVENSLLHAPGSEITLSVEKVAGNKPEPSASTTSGSTEQMPGDHPASTKLCEIKVSDTGPGIPLAKQELVFSEYYQLQNPERDRNKGLGLGLSIVKRLVDLLGHKLVLDSDSGSGTTFRLSVPLGELSLSETESPVTVDGVNSLEGLIVLVVDDEVDIRTGMEVFLGKSGCTVLATDSAESAREVLFKTNLVPDIIIADYRLRENKTGSEAIEVIREELNHDVPAFLITGDTSPNRVRDVIETGMRILHKPVQPHELYTVIKEVTSESENRIV